MIPLEELKAKVPHGYHKKIAEKAGVSRQSVSNFLCGRRKSAKIEKAVLEVLAADAEENQKLYEKIK